MAKEIGMMEAVCSVFKGPMGKWAYLGLAFALVFTAGFIYSGWRFWIAESVNDHFHWGVALLLAALLVAMMKIWFFLQMAKDEIIRKIQGK